MITQFPTQPDNNFTHYALLVLVWVITTTTSGWIGYRWGLRSQIETKKLEVKTAMLPLIEKFIIRANGGMDDWFGLRPDSISQLLEPAIKLKSLLTGHKRKLLIEAWDRFSKTTPDEFHITQPNEEGEKENQMRKLFLSRLTALKEMVQEI
jgi:hypothetical protein